MLGPDDDEDDDDDCSRAGAFFCMTAWGASNGAPPLTDMGSGTHYREHLGEQWEQADTEADGINCRSAGEQGLNDAF